MGFALRADLKNPESAFVINNVFNFDFSGVLMNAILSKFKGSSFLMSILVIPSGVGLLMFQ